MSPPSATAAWEEKRTSSHLWLLGFVGLSLALHAVGLVYLSFLKPPAVMKVQKPVELVMFEVKEPEPPPPPEPPPAPKEKVKPPPVKIAVVKPVTPPPPQEDAPPPPNDTPPPEPVKPILVTGVTLSSTTTAGGFAAPVGNTLYGKNPTTATNPADVKGYSAPRYVPPHQVDTPPELLTQLKVPYPEQAKREGVEGSVVLALVIDPDGKVVSAKVMSGPGFGLNEAALKAIRDFRFKAATKNGEPVSTQLTYKYTFVLD